ncbi:hypothetical protein [Helicobacter sp. T3_23-1056]
MALFSLFCGFCRGILGKKSRKNKVARLSHLAKTQNLGQNLCKNLAKKAKNGYFKQK